MKLMEYWVTHRNYNPRNPEHKKDLEAFLIELVREYGKENVLRALNELVEEAEQRVKEAMEKERVE